VFDDDDLNEWTEFSESQIENVGQDFSEDVIVSDKNIKMVLQLPINNRKQDIKVTIHDNNDNNSVTISYLDHEGRKCAYTSDIPYNVDFEIAKATFKNGILEIRINRK
jgi:HSP20 family molecular chaperone IbpA